MKIDTLTTEQTAKLSEYREKWLKIGLSCAPLDFEAAKDAAIRAYAVAGLPAPKGFYRMSSPLGAAILATVLNQVEDQVRAQVRAQVRDQVWDQVRAQVRDQVWDQVRDQVGEQVWEQVWDQVREQVRDQVGEQVWEQVGDQVRAQVYGSHDSSWLGFYEFFANECHIADVDRLRPLMDLAQVCGWWAPYQHAIIFQDRHSILRRDDQHRLHSEDGPAVAYLDGYSLFFWHGTAVPEHWITHKSNLSPEEVLKIENVEQRRAGCEIIGWDRILQELHAIEIDVNPNPQIGTLLEVDLPDAGKERFLRVKCGTGRMFALPVPPEMRSALEAQQWMWNDPNYQPEVRT